ncbi:MAG: hypothetical protein ABSC54_05385 [Smithellaceae bacterium]|jgi:hypothetical protein
MNIKRGKLFVAVIVNIVVICLALYVPEIRQAPLLIQILGLIVLAVLQIWAGPVMELINERIKRQAIIAKHNKLVIDDRKTRTNLTELQQVMISFLEHSEIYRERIKEKIKIEDDYVCVVKSSEGLSEVFTEKEEKEMLPFASVMMRIAGVIKPFERIALFLIPISSLPGINEWNLRKYINTRIIPQVEKEREQYLARTEENIAKKAGPFSYKYIAFILRKGTIVYDIKNRKFNHAFNEFLIQHQSKESYKQVKEELGKVIKMKDLLEIVNWSSFAKLNDAQKEIIEKYQLKISTGLRKEGIETLTQLSNANTDNVYALIWPIIKKASTKKKVMNLTKKIIEGAKTTVEILRRNGMNI